MTDDTDIQIPRRHDDGRKVYVIGPVERWIIAVAAGLIVSISYGYGNSVMHKLDTVAATALRVEVAQAVTTSEMNEMKAKQALMQQEVAKIPRLEIQSTTNAQDIRDIKQAEGLK